MSKTTRIKKSGPFDDLFSLYDAGDVERIRKLDVGPSSIATVLEEFKRYLDLDFVQQIMSYKTDLRLTPQDLSTFYKVSTFIDHENFDSSIGLFLTELIKNGSSGENEYWFDVEEGSEFQCIARDLKSSKEDPITITINGDIYGGFDFTKNLNVTLNGNVSSGSIGVGANCVDFLVNGYFNTGSNPALIGTTYCKFRSPYEETIDWFKHIVPRYSDNNPGVGGEPYGQLPSHNKIILVNKDHTETIIEDYSN